MKNVLTLLVLLLVASGAVHDARADEMAASETDLVTIRYDLRGLVPGVEGEQQWLQVLPFKLHHDWNDDDDVDWFEEEYDLPDAFYELITGILAPDEFSQANREIEARDQHTLVITAPESVHDSVRAAFDMVRAATHRRVVLQVDEFHLRRMPTAAEIADPDHLLESATVAFRDSRKHEMLLGQTSVLRLESSHRVLRDWDSEIAQGAFASDPEFDDWPTGSVSMLRLEESAIGGAFRLRFLHRASEVVEWETRETNARASVSVDSKVVSQPGTGVIDQPRIAVGTSVGSRLVGIGDAVTVASTVETADGPLGVVLRYRLESVAPAPEPVRFDLGQEYDGEELPEDHGLLVMRDLSALLWNATDVPRLDARQYWPTRYDGDTESIDPVGFPSTEWDVGRVEDVLDNAIYDGPGPSYRSMHGGWNLLAGMQAGLDRAERHVALTAPRGRALIVDVRIEAQPRTGGTPQVIGRVSLPLESSGSAMTLCGVGGLALTDYEVDVANSAASPDPRTTGYFDGLSVTARGIGDESVDLAITVHRLATRERVDLGAQTAGSIDRLGFDRLEVRRHVTADGEEHRWGGASMGLAGSMGLELVVSVRRE